MSGLDSAGFETKSLEEIQGEVSDTVKSAISPTLNTGSSSLLGQLIGAVSSQARQLWEVAQAVYASQDPDQATGAALAALGSLTGSVPHAPTKSQVRATLVLSAGTYAAGALAAHVLGDPTARFVNRDEIITAGGTVTNVRFEAEATGPVRANSVTLTVIAAPVSGWTSITNPLDAVLGSDTESDSDFRLRREQELTRRGSSTVDAIRADVLAVASFARVYENDTETTDGNGLPPHSFETLVLGGTDQEIADAIFATKPAGIQAYGTTSMTVTDQQGSGHVISFSRPTTVNIYLSIDVTYLSGQFAGVDALKTLLVDWGDANLGPGNDVIHNRLVQLIMSQPGMVDTTVRIGNAPSPSAQTNYVIGVRQIADFDTSRITISANAITGAP